MFKKVYFYDGTYREENKTKSFNGTITIDGLFQLRKIANIHCSINKDLIKTTPSAVHIRIKSISRIL